VNLPHITVLEAAYADKPVLRRLLELYGHDFSELTDADVDEHGAYGYGYLDQYWTEPERHPFLFRVEGHWAGLALVRAGKPNDMAEFFVLRKYRRHGVGRTAAREVLARFPGAWQVRQMTANAGATEFWRRAIPVDFDQELTERGPVQRFVMPHPE
jgi:predicted acetyltransferase